jgi:nucleotide-binding universal stress UspA family protein
MFNRIIVGLDGSVVAEEALPHAISLAETYGGMLSLVTVAHPLNELAGIGPSLTGQAAISQDVVARLESAREQIADRTCLDDVRSRIAETGIDVEARIREGRPAEQILKLATELHADLIVLTAYGGGGAHIRSQGAVFGGTADEVLRESRVPVLLIRP